MLSIGFQLNMSIPVEVFLDDKEWFLSRPLFRNKMGVTGPAIVLNNKEKQTIKEYSVSFRYNFFIIPNINN